MGTDIFIKIEHRIKQIAVIKYNLFEKMKNTNSKHKFIMESRVKIMYFLFWLKSAKGTIKIKQSTVIIEATVDEYITIDP